MTALPIGFLRQGIARGGIELRQTLTYWPDLVQALFFSGVSILVLFLLRGHHVPGSTFSLGSLASVEIDGSWRLGYVLLALFGWAAVGLLTRRRCCAGWRERAMLRAT